MNRYTQLVHDNMDDDHSDRASRSEMHSNIDNFTLMKERNVYSSMSLKDRDKSHDKYIQAFDQDIKELVRDNKYKG